MERTIHGKYLHATRSGKGKVDVLVLLPEHQEELRIGLSPREARELGMQLIGEAHNAEYAVEREVGYTTGYKDAQAPGPRD